MNEKKRKEAETYSEEKRFFDSPNRRSVRQFAESRALSNRIETIENAIKILEVEDSELVRSEALIAPPPPEEIVKKPGGKDFSTLNQFLVKTEQKVQGVPTSFKDLPKSKPIKRKTSPKEIKQDLLDRVVERHLPQEVKVRAVKKVLNNRMKKAKTQREVSYEVSSKSNSVFVEVKFQGEVIGLARAYGDNIPMSEVVHSYQCSEDLIDISYEYPEVMKGEEIRILEVNVASLDKSYRQEGIGTKMYENLIDGWRSQIKRPFVIIPERCSSHGSTSKMALRVWKSLKKKYPSSGFCIVIP